MLEQETGNSGKIHQDPAQQVHATKHSPDDDYQIEPRS